MSRVLREYQRIYIDIEKRFYEQIASLGLYLADAPPIPIRELEAAEVNIANSCSSFWLNNISPACVSCRRGLEMTTYFISMQCTKNCYFCFNPNQEDFEYYRSNLRNAAHELQKEYDGGVKYSNIALSGGEPLLHKKEMYHFLRTAKKLYPEVYLRLYTCGDFLDEACLKELQTIGLNEIRFSLKIEAGLDELEEMYDRIKLAKLYIPYVMVEMPVFPDKLEEMKGILIKLNSLGIAGINLLELCFPFSNVREFSARGYKLKKPAYRVLYNYIYSGGLPVAGSEDASFALLLYAAANNITMGLHYCSLENKLTGQIYRQNHDYKGFAVMDEDGYFLKSAKVFGDEIPALEKVLKKNRVKYVLNEYYNYLEFPLEYLALAAKLEPVISLQVQEVRDGKAVLRELKVVEPDKTQ